MQITITGITGFVGKNLSKSLIQNHKDICPISLRENDWKTKIDVNSHAIIHLAGKAHDTKNTAQADEYFKINTALTKELFDVFLESNIQTFVYFSSVKACADDVETILDESTTPNPKTPYGISKLKAEEYILSKVLPENKKVYIIRPCMIHGPGNKGNLNLLYNVVKKGVPYPLAKYQNERSFLSIDNLNFLIHKILETNKVPSGVYNFSDDEFISTNHLITIIAGVLNKKSRLLLIPKVIINSIAKLGDIIKLPLNSETVKKLTENYKVSNTKIKTALGIEKLPLTAKEGLEKTIRSFIEQ